MATKRVVLVGGGSGGHFYPLMAIAENLRSIAESGAGESLSLYYMGPDAYDADELKVHNIVFVKCPAGKRRRYRSALNFFDLFKSLLGTTIALGRLFWIYPDVIMSKGGYTSVPVVLAGWLLRIPIVIHESDAVAGAANKLGSRFAQTIAISYQDSAGAFPADKTVLTGIPVRKALLGPMAENAHQTVGIEPERPMVLILGGSQGAERVNALVIDALDELLPHYTVVHQTGERSIENIQQSVLQLVEDQALLAHYHPTAFLNAQILNQALHTASLVVSRAGSGSIYEIALHGKPSILIPIPGEISHDQRTNAYAYARTGAAVVMEEDNLKDGLLEAEIARIMGDQQLYEGMCEAARSFARHDAAERLAGLLSEIAASHS